MTADLERHEAGERMDGRQPVIDEMDVRLACGSNFADCLARKLRARHSKLPALRAGPAWTSPEKVKHRRDIGIYAQVEASVKTLLSLVDD